LTCSSALAAAFGLSIRTAAAIAFVAGFFGAYLDFFFAAFRNFLQTKR
jgi:hypothetical protein